MARFLGTGRQIAAFNGARGLLPVVSMLPAFFEVHVTNL